MQTSQGSSGGRVFALCMSVAPQQHWGFAGSSFESVAVSGSELGWSFVFKFCPWLETIGAIFWLGSIAGFSPPFHWLVARALGLQ